MNDWTSGYISEIGYTFGYYQELNPLRVKLAFIEAGIAYPETGVACELGFGQGVSTNIHASASMTQWWGTDFLPSQAAFANEMGTASQANIKLFDDSFEEFCSRAELPEFDFIGLHGIWSWISDQNREVIVDFLRRKLKIGGVLYVSFNTLPGWSTMAPVRHLMKNHVDIYGGNGWGVVPNIESAISFVEKLFELNPKFVKNNFSINERFQAVKKQNINYLAHEYFNADWHPMYFSDLNEWLRPAKLDYACSANFADAVDPINLNVEQIDFLSKIKNISMRETSRDYLTNQQFRKDYWVKGARKLMPAERMEKLRSVRFLLAANPEDIKYKISGNLGDGDLDQSIYKPIVDYLADHRIVTFAEVEKFFQGKISVSKLTQALIIMTSCNYFYLAQDAGQVESSRITSNKFNEYVLTKSLESNEFIFMASPVTGGGVPVTRLTQLFIHYSINIKLEESETINAVWNLIKNQGQKLTVEGAALLMDEENIKEISKQYRQFKEKTIPILRALQVI